MSDIRLPGDISLLANLGRVSLYRVENVDQNQKDGDEERHSARDNLVIVVR